MNDKNSKQKNSKAPKLNPKDIIGAFENIGETARKIGNDAAKQLNEELIKKAPGAAMEQIFGRQKVSGDIAAGESINVDEAYSGVDKQRKLFEKHIHYIRSLHEEERTYREKRTNELRMQLKELIAQVQQLAASTVELDEEIKIAVLQAPVEPGIYHIILFQEMVEYIQSFRKKIDRAVTWLHSANKRADKKNYWSMYKKHKGSFLLSSEHYLGRNAG